MSTVHKKRTTVGIYPYLVSRGSSIAFAGMLMLGLGLGSVFGVGDADGASLLRAIVHNQLELQSGQSLLQLVVGGVSGFAGIFIFIYICMSSRKGSQLIYAVPLLHGLSLGALIATVLATHGYGALSYITLCIFVPKAVETLLLLSVCNKVARYCKEQYQGKVTRKRGDGVPVLLYFVLFGAYFVLEALFILLFRGLL